MKKYILGQALASFMMLLVASSVVAQDRIDEQRSVSSNERISINVMRGEVTIRATDDEQFSVKGILDELAEGYELESSGGFTRFEVKMPRRTNYRGGNDEGSILEILVPRNAELKFESVNADVDVAGVLGGSDIGTVNGGITSNGLQGRVALGTVNGRITNTASQGRVDISTVNGRIEDTNSAGRISYETVNGRIDASGTADEVNANSVNGRIHLALPQAQDIRVQTVNGKIEVEVGHATPRLSAQSVGGGIELKFNADVNARFDVNLNAGGSIRNDLSNDEVQRPRFGPGRRLQFTHGQGEGNVDVTSVSGSVRLTR